MGMFDLTTHDPNDAAMLGKTLGIYVIHKIVTPEWAPMEAAIKNAIRGKVASVPWLPVGWAAAIEGIYSKYPEYRIMVYPAIGSTGKANVHAPTFADTPEKQEAWSALSKELHSIVSTYANGMREKGLQEMERLQADAAFWDTIYRAVKAVADAPKVVIGAAGDFASGIAGTFLKSFAPVLLLAGVGLVVWYNKAAIGKALGGRIVKAVG